MSLPKVAIRKLFTDKVYFRMIEEEFLSAMDKELDQYCSEKKPSLLRKSDSQSISSLNVKMLFKELSERCPIMAHVVSKCARKKCDKASEINICSSLMAFIIHARNQRMSAYAYKVGYFLRWSGLSTSVSETYYFCVPNRLISFSRPRNWILVSVNTFKFVVNEQNFYQFKSMLTSRSS